MKLGARCSLRKILWLESAKRFIVLNVCPNVAKQARPGCEVCRLVHIIASVSLSSRSLYSSLGR